MPGQSSVASRTITHSPSCSWTSTAKANSSYSIPDNFADLYEIPELALNAIRSYILEDFPVRIETPAKVSLFAYNNGTFIVHSFRDQPVNVTLLVSEGSTLTNLVTGDHPAELPRAKPLQLQRPHTPPLSAYRIEVQPHSYLAFTSMER
jgi:hypothetical protein